MVTLGVFGATTVGEFGFYVKGEAADAGFLGVSEAGFVVGDDVVSINAPKVGVMGVPNGSWSLVFPIDGCGDVGGEYGACNGVMVGCPIRSVSGKGAGLVVVDGAWVQA
jgi:hypothetical protein